MRTLIACLCFAVALSAGCAGSAQRSRTAALALTLQGSDLSMLVEAPDGNVTFKGTLAADAQTFQGKVTYINGEIFQMSGRRR